MARGSRPKGVSAEDLGVTIAEPSDFRLFRAMVLPHLKPQIPRLIAAGACMLVVSATTAALAWLLDPAIRLLFVERDASVLWVLGAAIVGVVTLKAIAGYGDMLLTGHVGNRVVADIQRTMFDRMVEADLARLSDVHSGRLVASFVYDAQLLRETVTKGVTGAVRDTTTILFLAAVMFWQNWQLALLASVAFPLAAILTRELGARMKRATGRTMSETGTLTSVVSETLDGRRIVKAYGLEDRARAQAGEAVERRFRFIMKGVKAKSAALPLTEFMGGLAVAAVIVVAGWQGLRGELAIGELVSFVAAMMLAFQPLRSLSQIYTVIAEGFAATRRLTAILSMRPAIADRPEAGPMPVPRGPGREIRFENVSFSYRDGTPALSNVSFIAEAGQTTALVGPSGAGKSTVLALLFRFFQPASGRILVDGVPVDALRIADLRRELALVTQEPFLFDDTIRENIALGRPGASDAEIEAAARAAAAHDFIGETPAGYGTRAGEAGLKLSGGQRQRIAIARAMLKDARILALDEATSALDTENERLVQEALGRLMQGRTTLVIAHRLSTVANADKIVVFDQGRIVEEGNHEALIARGGLYARLYAGGLDVPPVRETVVP